MLAILPKYKNGTQVRWTLDLPIYYMFLMQEYDKLSIFLGGPERGINMGLAEASGGKGYLGF